MPQRPLTTTQRGLGHDHQTDRQRQLRDLMPGTPCWRCGQPMWPHQELDLDHVTDRYFGGAGGPAVLAHASCNRSAGGKLGSQIAGAGLPRRMHSAPGPCAVCGKITDRSAKFCEVCGAHCHPSHSFVRTCGRKCGVELRRRIYGYAGSKPPGPRPPCQVCGKPVGRQPGARFCSIGCANQALKRREWPSSQLQHYICRYCGKPGVARATGQQREVCPERTCQLARLAANNLRTRHGLTADEANAQVAAIAAAGALTGRRGQWQASREW